MGKPGDDDGTFFAGQGYEAIEGISKFLKLFGGHTGEADAPDGWDYHNNTNMSAGESIDVTVLLNEWRSGDEDAGRQLIDAVYRQLHQLANACLRNESGASRLQPTALVNELYISMFSNRPPSCEDRLHFLNIAARQMRHLIVDHARRRHSLKRGGSAPRITLDEARDPVNSIDARLDDLNEALERLEQLDQRATKVVELRFFAGLTEQEIASVLNISVPTVKRDWNFARSWLLAQISANP
jgi:RNA polymerase sigma-70 factor (ECF subfamily)